MAFDLRRLHGGRPVGQHERHGHATVNADRQAVVGHPGIEPTAESRSPDGRLADVALNGAAGAPLDPSGPGQPHTHPATGRHLDADFAAGTRLNASCMSFLFGPGYLPRPFRARQQASSNAFSMRCGAVWLTSRTKPNLAKAWSVSGTASQRSGCCRFWPGVPPGVAALFERVVPDKAAHTSGLGHPHVLLLRGAEREGVGTKHHIKSRRHRIDQCQEQRRAFRPGLNAGASGAEIW